MEGIIPFCRSMEDLENLANKMKKEGWEIECMSFNPQGTEYMFVKYITSEEKELCERVKNGLGASSNNPRY